MKGFIKSFLPVAVCLAAALITQSIYASILITVITILLLRHFIND